MLIRHLDMPFGGTVTADDFYNGTESGRIRRNYLSR